MQIFLRRNTLNYTSLRVFLRKTIILLNCLHCKSEKYTKLLINLISKAITASHWPVIYGYIVECSNLNLFTVFKSQPHYWEPLHYDYVALIDCVQSVTINWVFPALLVPINWSRCNLAGVCVSESHLQWFCVQCYMSPINKSVLSGLQYLTKHFNCRPYWFWSW